MSPKVFRLLCFTTGNLEKQGETMENAREMHARAVGVTMKDIPDARIWGPVGEPKCDCLEKTKAAEYLTQYSCEECEPLIAKIERAEQAVQRRPFFLTEFDEDGDEIEDPWKALDQFCANKNEYHVWTEMGMRLRKTAKSLLRIYLLSTDQGARTEALATLLEIGMPPPKG